MSMLMPIEDEKVGNDGSTEGTKECSTTMQIVKESDNYGSLENENIIPSSSVSNGDYSYSAKKDKLTYITLMSSNSNFRYFFLSYLINHMGEWMTYLASLTLIQRVTYKTSDGKNQNTNTMVSILILVKLLPNVIFLPIGGVLADSYDRRNIQITLNLICSLTVVVFLWSLYTESINLCLLANFLVETMNGLYCPSNEAMIPQLLPGKGSNDGNYDEALKKANVLYGMAWSLMTAVGSALGGVFVANFGIQGCFVIDSITYLISAAVMYFGVKGNFNVSSIPRSIHRGEKKQVNEIDFVDESLSLLEENCRTDNEQPRSDSNNDGDKKITTVSATNNNNDDSIDTDINDESGGLVLFVRGLKFLIIQKPLVGACALLKGSASLVYGAVDVLNVAYSARGSEMDPSRTSYKLGLLFGCVGVGCIIGSMTSDAFSDLTLPRRTARVCLCGFLSMGIGMLWMWATPDVFVSLCLSTVVRSIGSAVVWINSSLLIQKYTPPGMLGRVTSFDSGVALCAEAVSALGGGMLMDQRGLSAEGLTLILGCIAFWSFFFWSPILAFRF